MRSQCTRFLCFCCKSEIYPFSGSVAYSVTNATGWSPAPPLSNYIWVGYRYPGYSAGLDPANVKNTNQACVRGQVPSEHGDCLELNVTVYA